MRKQYHFRPGPHGLQVWDVDRLLALARDLPVIQIRVSAIRELDEPYWFDDGKIPTCRDVAEHARLMNEADLSFPIILSSSGRVMDGMHRAAKAAMQNLNSLPAKQFAQDPEPDFVGVDRDDLPY
ncbi:MAG TPA: hypothetical protein VEU95_07220 [Micropepsaceae bacterium]|nr:hypothetical protein [Micropepsaceae bacterium]